jgi:hypothetical protein
MFAHFRFPEKSAHLRRQNNSEMNIMMAIRMPSRKFGAFVGS